MPQGTETVEEEGGQVTDNRTMTEITGMTEEELRAKLDEMMADYTPPNDEQLARVVLVTKYGAAPDAFVQATVDMLNADTNLKDRCLAAHREMQEDAYLLAIALEEVAGEAVKKLG
jgi:hypothetical protein